MGKYFESIDELYAVLNRMFEVITKQEDIREPLINSNLLIKFTYKDPQGYAIMDFRKEEPAWFFGNTPENIKKVDVEMILSADTANIFWNGKLNVPAAIATLKIIAKGSIPKALALLPVIKPAFKIYPQVLKDMGKDHLIITETSKDKFSVKRDGFFKRLFSHKNPPNENQYKQFFPTSIPLAHEPIQYPVPIKPVNRPSDTNELFIEMYYTMNLIRYFEEQLQNDFKKGNLPTEVIHVSIGQEAIAVGTCFALEARDYINTTHRGHGHLIAKGVDVNRLLAEIYGKQSGICKGKGGSMHVIDNSIGVMGSNGIVGAGLLLGNGAALSSKFLKQEAVSVVFFGDGATNQGMFHEALNFAMVFQLPVIFICENNQYGEFTPLKNHTKVEQLSHRATAYSMKSITIDGNDVIEVYNTLSKIIKNTRENKEPILIECLTYRWSGHMEGDEELYRSQAEVEEWKAKCPIQNMKKHLINEKIASEDELKQLEAKAVKTIEAAVDFTTHSSDPDPKEAYMDLYSPEPDYLYNGVFQQNIDGKEMTVSQAINSAITEEMEHDETVIMLGEDVFFGGYFGVSIGLGERFGRKRIIDTPISENAIVGGAVGAATTGLRPISEILFSDFLTTCVDPIVNQAAKLRYMSGGQNQVPMVVRTPIGGYLGLAAQHSQSFESLLVGVPGLIVLAPSDPYSAKGILKSAIRSNNPVLFFEHKLLYLETGLVPQEEYILPIGKSRIIEEGEDITLVGILYSCNLARHAAKILKDKGVSCEVIDPITLYPLDIKTIAQSVMKTGRLIVVEEATLTLGMGAEIAARIQELLFDYLKKPIKRVATPDIPCAYSKALEMEILPSVDKIINAVLSIL